MSLSLFDSEDRVRRLRTPLVLTAVAALAACAPVAYESYPSYGGQSYSYAPSLPPPVPLRPQAPPNYGYGGDGRYAPPPSYAAPYQAPYGTPYAAPSPAPYGDRGPYATQPYPGQGPYSSTPYGDDRGPYAARPYPEGSAPYAAPTDPYRDDGNRYGYRPEPTPDYGQPNAPSYRPEPYSGGSGNPPIQRQDVPPPSLGAPTWR